jgi:hypothetical protein
MEDMYKRVVYFPAVVSEKIEAMAGQDKKHSFTFGYLDGTNFIAYVPIQFWT